MEIVKKIGATGVLPVINIPNSDIALPIAKALIDGGMLSLEVTLRSRDSLESIAKIKKAYPDLVLGAGTVLNVETVDKALNAGADFIVAPGFDEEVVDYCNSKGVIIVPGCSNPTEIQKAIKKGLDVIKFFPAEINGGVNALKLYAGAFSSVKFVPTGGITLDNLKDYLSLPNVLACGGSFMAPSDKVKNQEFDKIIELSKKAISISMGFELAHVGINHKDKQTALNTASLISEIFGFDKKYYNSATFSGTYVENMHSQGYGENGHIGFSTISMKRAMDYLTLKGVKFNQESVKKDEKGNVTCIYLKDDIAGFAFHIVKK